MACRTRCQLFGSVASSTSASATSRRRHLVPGMAPPRMWRVAGILQSRRGFPPAPPGARYAYSSYGYNLVGAALEAALDAPFPEIVRRQVLGPLGMHATGPDFKGARELLERLTGANGVEEQTRQHAEAASRISP